MNFSFIFKDKQKRMYDCRDLTEKEIKKLSTKKLSYYMMIQDKSDPDLKVFLEENSFKERSKENQKNKDQEKKISKEGENKNESLQS